jgi:glycosyltransferase involved in cell wall biosynthesis
LPTFNRLQYLRAAIDSVFAQTFADWELIVADDGSEAETADYLTGMAKPPRVQVLQLPHTGNPGAVRNAAWRAARGEYIAFLDSDDVWLPQKLALQVAALRSQPQYGWSHTAFAVIDESGQLLSGARARSWPATEGWILESLIRLESVIAMPSVLVTRRLLEQLGGFDPGQRACEDYDLYLRLAGLSAIQGVRETLVLVRSHGERYHNACMVYEGRARALAKLLAATTDRSQQSLIRRENAKVATALARIQAADGGRWAALRTLVKSSRDAWVYPEWWLRGAVAVARAVTPAGVVRVARVVVGRGRSH